MRTRRLAAAFCLALAAAPAGHAVVGGSSTRVASAPWAVVVRQFGAAVCSGTIIDSYHVVTAAHCVTDMSGTPVGLPVLSVTAGVSDARVPLPADARQDRGVLSVRVDPGYKPSETVAVDDVAVLTLFAPLDLDGRAVRAVALPPAGWAVPAAMRLRLAGFGRASATPGPDGPLRWMSPVAQPEGLCGSLEVAVVGSDHGATMCAAAAGAAVCDGDSGAGLVTTTAHPVLVGVLDAAPAGCKPGSEAVYAFVGAAGMREFLGGPVRRLMRLC